MGVRAGRMAIRPAPFLCVGFFPISDISGNCPDGRSSMKFSCALKLNHIFRRLYATSGQANGYLVMYARRNRSDINRIGITAGKKLGCAVKRNRAKRVITVAFRECLPYIKEGYDFVIVARTRILNIKSTAAAASMRSLLSSAGVWSNEDNGQAVNTAD